MFLSQLRSVDPEIVISEDRMTFTVVKPNSGDWLMVALIVVISIPLAWYTTKNWHYALLSALFYWGMAYTLIDDTFKTVVDKTNNLISVSKSKFGRVKWVRASAADELIDAHVTTVDIKGRISYKLELEFLSDFGYYRLETSETSLIGERNKETLEKIVTLLTQFMDLKPLPDKFKEENLGKSLPTTLSEADRDELRKR